MKETGNLFYAQSGGVTPVINATAAGVIDKANEYKSVMPKVFMGHNGILGLIHENLINGSTLTSSQRKQLLQSPGGAFGSCRFKLPEEIKDDIYKRCIQVFKAHNIKYFLYNGGGDSQHTCLKISQASQYYGYPMSCIGLPKTIDNDLPVTDNCPGFGSTAKYIAVSTQEIALDVVSMHETSTKVFIFEVMGRHAGWLAAASAIGKNNKQDAPHLILFPERSFDAADFLRQTASTVSRYGYCIVVASEGIRNAQGEFVSDSNQTDAFGHTQLGGVAASLSNLVVNKLKMKTHFAIADYLQRSARHIASKTDLDQAYAVGAKGVELAINKKSEVMVTIKRRPNAHYRWTLSHTPLSRVAAKERKLPNQFISANGYGITSSAKSYLRPLIGGEAYPEYRHGLPRYLSFAPKLTPKKLPHWNKPAV